MCFTSVFGIRLHLTHIDKSTQVNTVSELDKYLGDHDNKAVAGFCSIGNQACATVMPIAQVKASRNKIGFVSVDKDTGK